jgi:hypothetical protein
LPPSSPQAIEWPRPPSRHGSRVILNGNRCRRGQALTQYSDSAGKHQPVDVHDVRLEGDDRVDRPVTGRPRRRDCVALVADEQHTAASTRNVSVSRIPLHGHNVRTGSMNGVGPPSERVIGVEQRRRCVERRAVSEVELNDPQRVRHRALMIAKAIAARRPPAWSIVSVRSDDHDRIRP